MPCREVRPVVVCAALLGGQQGQPIPLAQVPRCHDKEVPPVQGCDLADIQALGESYHARVHRLQAQGCVLVSSPAMRP